jgi:hypothetical protein
MARSVSGPVNTRSGPGTTYPAIGQTRSGETYQIIGRNADTSWWQVCCVDGKQVWIAAEVVEASHVHPGIPVVAAAPPPTPRPTPRPLACATNAGPTFARVWNRDRLGCPRGPETVIWSAYEVFERGWMLWRQDNDEHYAFLGDGAYTGYWYPPSEPPDFACTQAQALGRPRRGFSRVWCENPAIRQRIGNALDDEIGSDRSVQEFDNGFMVYIGERGTTITAFKDNTWTEQR